MVLRLREGGLTSAVDAIFTSGHLLSIVLPTGMFVESCLGPVIMHVTLFPRQRTDTVGCQCSPVRGGSTAPNGSLSGDVFQRPEVSCVLQEETQPDVTDHLD